MCACVCMRVLSIYTYIRACVCVCQYICMYECMYVRACARMRLSACVLTSCKQKILFDHRDNKNCIPLSISAAPNGSAIT